MIEAEILKSILNNDHELANFLWSNYQDEVKNILKKTRLKDYFLRLTLSTEDQLQSEIYQYLKEKKFTQRVKGNFIKNLSSDLRSYDVEHIVFKGSIFSKIYYDHLTDRAYSDFDILIKNNSYEKLYNYLNEKNYKHHNNYKYIERTGFCRTALEVIYTDFGAIDIHHRIFSKFYRKACPLTEHAFFNAKITDGINHAADEINLCIVLYHAFKQNQMKLDPYFLVDFDRILKSSDLSRKKLSIYLNNYGLEDQYKYCLKILDKINMNKDIPKKIFDVPNKKNISFTNFGLKTQLNHFLDPLPYMRIKTGNDKFSYISFLKIKFGKLFYRN